MGIIGFANVDVQAMSERDETVAASYDTRSAEVLAVAEIGRRC
jgi:hypothetical protein